MGVQFMISLTPNFDCSGVFWQVLGPTNDDFCHRTVSSELTVTVQGSAGRVGQRDESLQEEQRLAVTRERTMLESIASFPTDSSCGGGGRPTSQAEDQATGQATDHSSGQSTDQTADQTAGRARGRATEQASEEVGGEVDRDGGEDGSGEEAVSLTPAELLAADDRAGSDDRRNHTCEGRCPVCGVYIRTLREAQMRRHFEECNIHYHQLVAEPPIASERKRKRKE